MEFLLYSEIKKANSILLTLSSIILKNGQTYIKILMVFISQDF